MTTPQVQTALLVTEIGKSLTVTHDRPVPQANPSQLQIKVTVAGLNPHDQQSRDVGLFIGDNLPTVLAADIVGTVAAVGSSIPSDTFQVGDRIVSQANLLSQGGLQSGLQQYAVVDAAYTAKIPESITDEEAATLPVNLVTGVIVLFDEANLGIPAPWNSHAATFDYANTSLLIVGGGGNCGRFGVQLARLAGLGKIVVVGGDQTQLQSFSATHVLDRHGSSDEILSQIRDIVGDELLFAYDAVNEPAGQVLALNALSNTQTGKMARLLRRPPVNFEDLVGVGKKAGFEVKDILGNSHSKHDLTKVFWERLPAFLRDGKIVPLDYAVIDDGLNNVNAVNAVLDQYRDKRPGMKKTLVRISKRESRRRRRRSRVDLFI